MKKETQTPPENKSKKMTPKKAKEVLTKDLYHELRKKGVKRKQILFCAEYLSNGMNATRAYLDTVARKNANYDTASAAGCELLTRDSIQETIRVVFNKWLGEKKLKLENLLVKQLYARAFYDPLMFINPDGTLKIEKSDDVDKEYRCCIDSIETRYYGKDADRKVVVLKLADRKSAMQELIKYIDMFKEKGNVLPVSLTEDTIGALSNIFNNKKKK